MRDAFGGVFTMNLLIVFIFIYIAVTAVSLNYAKAFKVKNAVIDYIEERQISDLDQHFDYFRFNLQNQNFLDEDLDRLSYHKTCEEVGYKDNILIQNVKNLFGQDEYCYRGVVIKETSREPIEGTNSKIVYYEVKTYASWNLGVFNKLLALVGKGPESPLKGTWTVKGEAKVVVSK